MTLYNTTSTSNAHAFPRCGYLFDPTKPNPILHEGGQPKVVFIPPKQDDEDKNSPRTHLGYTLRQHFNAFEKGSGQESIFHRSLSGVHESQWDMRPANARGVPLPFKDVKEAASHILTPSNNANEGPQSMPVYRGSRCGSAKHRKHLGRDRPVAPAERSVTDIRDFIAREFIPKPLGEMCRVDTESSDPFVKHAIGIRRCQAQKPVQVTYGSSGNGKADRHSPLIHFQDAKAKCVPSDCRADTDSYGDSCFCEQPKLSLHVEIESHQDEHSKKRGNLVARGKLGDRFYFYGKVYRKTNTLYGCRCDAETDSPYNANSFKECEHNVLEKLGEVGLGFDDKFTTENGVDQYDSKFDKFVRFVEDLTDERGAESRREQYCNAFKLTHHGKYESNSGNLLRVVEGTAYDRKTGHWAYIVGSSADSHAGRTGQEGHTVSTRWEEGMTDQRAPRWMLQEWMSSEEEMGQHLELRDWIFHQPDPVETQEEINEKVQFYKQTFNSDGSLVTPPKEQAEQFPLAVEQCKATLNEKFEFEKDECPATVTYGDKEKGEKVVIDKEVRTAVSMRRAIRTIQTQSSQERRWLHVTAQLRFDHHQVDPKSKVNDYIKPEKLQSIYDEKWSSTTDGLELSANGSSDGASRLLYDVEIEEAKPKGTGLYSVQLKVDTRPKFSMEHFEECTSEGKGEFCLTNGICVSTTEKVQDVYTIGDKLDTLPTQRLTADGNSVEKQTKIFVCPATAMVFQKKVFQEKKNTNARFPEDFRSVEPPIDLHSKSPYAVQIYDDNGQALELHKEGQDYGKPTKGSAFVQTGGSSWTDCEYKPLGWVMNGQNWQEITTIPEDTNRSAIDLVPDPSQEAQTSRRKHCCRWVVASKGVDTDKRRLNEKKTSMCPYRYATSGSNPLMGKEQESQVARRLPATKIDFLQADVKKRWQEQSMRTADTLLKALNCVVYGGGHGGSRGELDLSTGRSTGDGGGKLPCQRDLDIIDVYSPPQVTIGEVPFKTNTAEFQLADGLFYNEFLQDVMCKLGNEGGATFSDTSLPSQEVCNAALNRNNTKSTIIKACDKVTWEAMNATATRKLLYTEEEARILCASKFQQGSVPVQCKLDPELNGMNHINSGDRPNPCKVNEKAKCHGSAGQSLKHVACGHALKSFNDDNKLKCEDVGKGLAPYKEVYEIIEDDLNYGLGQEGEDGQAYTQEDETTKDKRRGKCKEIEAALNENPALQLSGDEYCGIDENEDYLNLSPRQVCSVCGGGRRKGGPKTDEAQMWEGEVGFEESKTRKFTTCSTLMGLDSKNSGSFVPCTAVPELTYINNGQDNKIKECYDRLTKRSWLGSKWTESPCAKMYASKAKCKAVDNQICNFEVNYLTNPEKLTTCGAWETFMQANMALKTEKLVQVKSQNQSKATEFGAAPKATLWARFWNTDYVVCGGGTMSEEARKKLGIGFKTRCDDCNAEKVGKDCFFQDPAQAGIFFNQLEGLGGKCAWRETREEGYCTQEGTVPDEVFSDDDFMARYQKNRYKILSTLTDPAPMHPYTGAEYMHACRMQKQTWFKKFTYKTPLLMKKDGTLNVEQPDKTQDGVVYEKELKDQPFYEAFYGLTDDKIQGMVHECHTLNLERISSGWKGNGEAWDQIDETQKTDFRPELDLILTKACPQEDKMHKTCAEIVGRIKSLRTLLAEMLSQDVQGRPTGDIKSWIKATTDDEGELNDQNAQMDVHLRKVPAHCAKAGGNGYQIKDAYGDGKDLTPDQLQEVKKCLLIVFPGKYLTEDMDFEGISHETLVAELKAKTARPGSSSETFQVLKENDKTNSKLLENAPLKCDGKEAKMIVEHTRHQVERARARNAHKTKLVIGVTGLLLGAGAALAYMALVSAVASATASVSGFGSFVGGVSGFFGFTGTTTAVTAGGVPLALPFFGSLVTQTTVAGIVTSAGATAALGTVNAILIGTMAVGGAGVVGGTVTALMKDTRLKEDKDDSELALGVNNPNDADADAES